MQALSLYPRAGEGSTFDEGRVMEHAGLLAQRPLHDLHLDRLVGSTCRTLQCSTFAK